MFPPLVILLITPAHLNLLLKNNLFIRDVLKTTIASYAREIDPVNVVVAVVDGIPGPSQTVTSNAAIAVNENDAAIACHSIPNVGRGHQGISVAVLRLPPGTKSIWSEAKPDPALEHRMMSSQQRSTLNFSIPPSVHALEHPEAQGFQAIAPRLFQLPVANTIFQNGKSSTILTQQWAISRAKTSAVDLDFHLVKRGDLQGCNIDLSGLFVSHRNSPSFSLYSQLAPITPSRIVTAAMGNIIRRLEIEGTKPVKEVPASQELEAAISAGNREGRLPSQPLGIWALVRPTSPPAPISPTWGGDEQQRIQRAVLSGCRLHKVLSGGGGWGDKQGLLALDPDAEYAPLRHGFGFFHSKDECIGAEKQQTFGGVVKPGDQVEFYVCREPEADSQNRILPSSSKGISEGDLKPPSISFGSLPSTADEMQSIPSEDLNEPSSSARILDAHFGMLSESGMSMKVSSTVMV